MRNRNVETSNPALLTEPNMEKELVEIRKEVVESRNLVIKTDNLLKNLHAELKQMAKRQDEIARKGWVGSFVAYGLIATLCLGAAVLVSNARLSAAHEDTSVLTKQVDDLKAQVAKLEKDASDHKAQEVRESAERRATAEVALRAYSAIVDGAPENRLKGIDELAKVDRSKLTPLENKSLDDRARMIKGELAQTAFDSGRNAFRKQDFKTASTQLQRFLVLAPDAPEALYATFLLGNSLHASKDFVNAIPPLEHFVQDGKGLKNVDYACLLLGEAHLQTNNAARATEVLRKCVDEYPSSEFIQGLRRVLAQAKGATDVAAAAAAGPNGTTAPVAPSAPTATH
jgi:TolA-binding protein